MNQRVTESIRLSAMASRSTADASGVSAKETASTNKLGCSPQYFENSTNSVGDKMKGGAVKVSKSPLNSAMLLRNDDHDPDWALGRELDEELDIVVAL